MERSGVLRWLIIGLGIFLLLQFFDPFGTKESKLQPLSPEQLSLPPQAAPERICDIWTGSFHAALSTRGASVKRFELLTAKYRRDNKPLEIATTPDVPLNQHLRFNWRNGAAGPEAPNWQVAFDLLDFELEQADGKSCVFAYRTEQVELKKTVRATERPYELAVEATITNLADRPLKHALAVHSEAWRRHSEVQAGMFSVSPYVTHVECVSQDGSAVRKTPGDFEPDDFAKAEFVKGPTNPGDWYQPKPAPDLAAVSNAYFTQVVSPLSSTAKAPSCQLQIEERWNHKAFKKSSADPNSGYMYRARLAYEPVELAPKQSASYTVLSYVGPKEREVLAQAAGGKKHLDEIIDLGFFSTIAKVLVAFLLKVYSVIPNWGIAIVILTITARVLLFPLSVPSIKSMMKMRELKPELDALNEKYKDDPQAKGLAQMELWRKHSVNPLKGCLPQLASMPVWFALYTTLQTAVELYNIPFLWFPDLSQPDPYFLLPLVIGATYFVQQRMLPPQGDPMQQKMMMYVMPAMFTVFMLFLPAGLGVYMFTNSVLGIVQQQAVEWHVRRTTKSDRGEDIQVKFKEEPGASGKPGSSRDKNAKSAKVGDEAPLLGKGKA